MKRLILIMITCLTRAGVCQGKTITVDDGGPSDFSTIQAAIDAASNGDTIVVEEGTYFENINFRGKDLVLRSTDPNNPDIVAATIIDGNNLGSVVTFDGTENATCVLSGFTVRNGYANYGAGIYGGTWEKQTRAEIRNNMIATNTLWYGGALDYCNGTIQNNIISGTTILCDGGAIFDCQGIIKNNTILDNPIGLIRCNGIIQNNTLSGNGAAVGECDGIIQNNIIFGNQGGLMYCNGIIQNNTISDNPTGIYRGDEAVIRNNIISGNHPDLGLIYCYGLIEYNLVSGWTGGGEGNIDADPCFADPNNGDYHLKSHAGRWDTNEGRWTIDEVTSSCIDAGDPMTPIMLEPFPNGGIINMGAYGGTAEASKSYFGKPPCEIIVAGDINGDCAVNFLDFRLMALRWLMNGNL